MFKKLFQMNKEEKVKRSTDSIIVKSPIKGKVLSLEEVPDDVFAQKLLGEGIAMIPEEGTIYSPVDGEVIQLFMPSKHAIGIKSNDGVEVLIHIGIDTVKMNGDGFEAFVDTGSTVKCGQELIRFDIDKVEKNAKTVITPIVITNSNELKNIDIIANGNVDAGEEVIKIDK